MTDVLVIDKDVVVEVKQPTIPPTAQPPKIGLVEINQMVARGSIWSTGSGVPVAAGGQAGDMYLDVDTGNIYEWNGTAWVFKGTFAPATLTPAEILAAIITVDGAGSDLDADKLDGQHGAYYATQADMTAVEGVNTTQDGQIAANASAITFNANNITALQTDMTAVEAGQTAAAILAKLITVDGAGSGLDADTLDGHDTSFFLPAGNYTAADILTKIKTVDGTGSGLDADLLDGHDTSFFLPAGSYTAADILAKLLTVDGSGSGLDADMVDGHDTAYLLALANATGTISDAQHGNRVGGTLHALASSTVPGFMQDAPADSFVYGRKNNAWATVIGGATTDDNPPAGPLQDGQMWWKSSTGVLYLWYDDGNSQQWVQAATSPQVVDAYYQRKTARQGNRVANANALVSQENGTTNVTANNSYPADQWVLQVNNIVGNAQKITPPGGASPDGSLNCIALYASTAKPVLAAGDILSLSLPIEGLDVADFQWGTAAAKPAVLRFNVYCPTAGTYAVKLRNNAADRVFLASFTLSAAAWKTISIPVPGDATGTWVKDSSGAGIIINFGYAVGSTYVGVAGWQAGNFSAPPGCTNGAAVANTVIYITDVGLYVDPDNTGVAPELQSQDFVAQLLKCQRYYRQLPVSLAAYGAASGDVQDTQPLSPQMRGAPVVSIASAGTTNNVAAVNTYPAADRINVQLQPTAVGNMGVFNRIYALNARMI